MSFKALVVDDDSETLKTVEELLTRIGDVQTTGFASARQALGWVQHNDIDFVIVDYMMPELNGTEFIRQLRTIPEKKDIPVLIITANDQKHIRYRALDAGATDFLSTPLDRVEFMARVSNLLQLIAGRNALKDRASWLADEVRKATLEIVQRERETVVRLSKAAEYRDPETGAHILRMAHYSELIAKGLGLSKADQDLVLQAAPMHDIGKVGVSDNILLKPGRLTPDEFELMKQHAVYGYEILQDSSSRVLQAGAAIALGHHEKYDGSGYPNALSGSAIPIFSRIVAVADVFDALTSERPYKKAWTLEQAAEHIKVGAGSHFDPKCVAVFVSHWNDVLQIRQRFKDAREGARP